MGRNQWAWAAGAAVVVMAAAAYVNTLDGEWVWDDISSVLLHRHVQDPAKLGQLFREDQHAFGRGQGNFYRPLVAASFMLDYALSGGPSPAEIEASGRAYPELSPLVFHLTNLLWHALAALLLFMLLARLAAPPAAAAAAAMLFAVHPLHTEAVAYISGRADMMSAALMFAALNLSLPGAAGARRVASLAAGLLCFAAALCSKESSLIYPVLLAVALGVAWAGRDRAETDGQSGVVGAAARHFLPLAGAVLVLCGYVALRATVLRFAPAGGGAAAPLGQRLVETCQSFALYMRMLFWPAGLHMERTLAGVPRWTAAVGALLLLALAAGVLLAARARRWRVAGGIVWFIAAWLPISGVFPINAPLAEHWMYVPMAGFWWALMELLAEPRAGKPGLAAPLAAACAGLIVFLPMTVARNADWHDNERLFRATLDMNPASVRVHYNLAVTYGDILHNPAGARRHYEAVLRLQGQDRPGAAPAATVYVDEAELRLSLGRALEESGDHQAAAEHYRRVLGRKSGAADEMGLAALGLGRCLLAQGDWSGAVGVLEQLASRDPAALPEVERLLGPAPFSEDF